MALKEDVHEDITSYYSAILECDVFRNPERSDGYRNF